MCVLVFVTGEKHWHKIHALHHKNEQTVTSFCHQYSFLGFSGVSLTVAAMSLVGLEDADFLVLFKQSISHWISTSPSVVLAWHHDHCKTRYQLALRPGLRSAMSGVALRPGLRSAMSGVALRPGLRSAMSGVALLPLFWWRSTVSPAFFGQFPRSSLHSFVPFPLCPCP